MVKIRGILSDNEIDHVERKALVKEPTKIQKGGNLKAKIVIFFYKLLQVDLTTTQFHSPTSSR